MKKILFATTALVATASVAAADVSFSGYGRFGAISQETTTDAILATGTPAAIAAATAVATASAAAAAAAAAAYNAAVATGTATAAQALAVANTAGLAASDAAALDAIDGTAATSNTVEGIYTRLRLQVDMTTEADNGLTFGARVRHQVTTVDAAPAGNQGFNGARFYATAGGLTVAAGNIIGSIEGMSNLYMSNNAAGIGLSGLGFHNLVTNTVAKGYWGWDAYSSGGGGANGIEVMYSAGDFSGAISYSNNGGVENTALNMAYTFNDWTVALGYQDSTINTNDKIVLTVGGNIGPAKVVLGAADNDGETKIALSGIIEVGAATKLEAFVSTEDTAGEAFGIGVQHDLGGGAALRGGIVSNQRDDIGADLGIVFNF